LRPWIFNCRIFKLFALSISITLPLSFRVPVVLFGYSVISFELVQVGAFLAEYFLVQGQVVEFSQVLRTESSLWVVVSDEHHPLHFLSFG
jgi:uncharacterized membrane protein